MAELFDRLVGALAERYAIEREHRIMQRSAGANLASTSRRP